MKRCKHIEADGFHHCGSYAFNLEKDDIDQGDFCDVHYWQGRAHRAEALAEQPAQQEPWGACVYGRVFVGRLPEHARKFSEDEGVPIQWLYTSPQSQRKPLTDEWVPVTQNLLNEQHPWLYQPMWVAMKGGVVVQGYYEWRQGRNPDRFITDLGDEWAFNVDFVKPVIKPTPPAIEAAHGIKENT